MIDCTVLSWYDDSPCDELQRRAGSPKLVVVDRCASTMDLAHQLAADGAPHGTAVVADEQDAGRGRTGKSWTSARGAGVWVSVLLRGAVATSAGVLSLRTGLELAHALDTFAGSTIQLKWPNDLFHGGMKLAGILTEARWRGDQLEWIVVGVGINMQAAVRGAGPGRRPRGGIADDWDGARRDGARWGADSHSNGRCRRCRRFTCFPVSSVGVMHAACLRCREH